MSRLPLYLVLLVAALAGACGKHIGDACGNNVDCSVTGDCFCDIAPPGGYCTVEGCDVKSCPDDSVCVRFYTVLASQACTYSPAPEHAQGDPNASDPLCDPDERCLCDDSIDGICNSPTGHCAPENSERRWCMKTCGDNGDCRDGFQCRSTGSKGAVPVPSLTNAMGDASKFCVSIGN